MKKFFIYISRTTLYVTMIAVVSLSQMHAAIRFTNNDPWPMFSTENPLAMYTFWKQCEPEQHGALSVTVFRQNADAGKNGPFFEGTCVDAPDSCTSCIKVCDTDVPIGDIHGRWNMIALLYPEANGNTCISTKLINALELNVDGANGVTGQTAIDNALRYILNPSNRDQEHNLGFFSVPIKYRKYGVRVQAELGSYCGLGFRVQAGVATIRQDADFDDKTCSANGIACGTGTSSAACTVNQPSCDVKTLVINGIMKKREIVADVLGLNIRNFCETDLEEVTLSMYWTRCFEYNAETTNACWPWFTLAPYFIGEVSIPASNKCQDNNVLFSLPFGNGRHVGAGFTGGFNVNFVETIQLGFEVGFMHFSKELYANYPVATNNFQNGMLSRKADLCIQPDNTWTFAATMGASEFIDCLSAYVQYRLIHHCEDCLSIKNVISNCTPNTPPFDAASVDLEQMIHKTPWVSSFVDVHFDYDITKNIALGFLWQGPVAQEFAYRPTTVMGSVIVKY